MAGTYAMAQGLIASLRQDIARIEGRLPEWPGEEQTPCGGNIVIRQGQTGRPDNRLSSGAKAFDTALGNGLPLAALTEIHGTQTRDAGLVAGFALAMASRLPESPTPLRPLLWVVAEDVLQEAGELHLPGIARHMDISPEAFLVARPRRSADAFWIADEAASLSGLAALILEIRGTAQGLDLTATRRLHKGATKTGRPIFLLRQAASTEPTAAPVRLVVGPAAAGKRETIDGPLEGSIRHSAFAVSISKSPANPQARFILEWNSNDKAFEQAARQDNLDLVSLPGNRQDRTAPAGTLLPFPSPSPESTSGPQPSRKQYPAYRRA